jgi:hypothetical protein
MTTEKQTSKIVLLTGYAGTGKDTLAWHLEQSHGYKRYAFADALKQMAVDIRIPIRVPATGRYIQSPTLEDFEELKRDPESNARQVLQDLGNCVREHNSSYWVRVIVERIKREVPERVVITDCRYENEFGIFSFNFGSLWKCDMKLCAVTRPGYGPLNGHVSETNVEDLIKRADFTVENVGTPFEMVQQFLAHA